MRYPADHRTVVRDRIVAAAARALREKGLDGVSVPALMRHAGLTHGGFYHHFPDRDTLVAEAVARAAAETGAAVFEGNADDRDAALAAYLSPEHVASPGDGCVLAALGAEAAHAESPRVRGAFATAARGFLAYVQRLVAPASRRRPDDDALVLSAQMIGAVVLARMVDDPALAARILRAVRRASAS